MSRAYPRRGDWITSLERIKRYRQMGGMKVVEFVELTDNNNT